MSRPDAVSVVCWLGFSLILLSSRAQLHGARPKPAPILRA
jgi:hypothetical protein